MTDHYAEQDEWPTPHVPAQISPVGDEQPDNGPTSTDAATGARVDRDAELWAYDELSREAVALRQGLWDVWVALGHDTDGDTGPGAWIAGSGLDVWIAGVVRDAAEWRRQSEDDYAADTDALRDEVERLESRTVARSTWALEKVRREAAEAKVAAVEDAFTEARSQCVELRARITRLTTDWDRSASLASMGGYGFALCASDLREAVASVGRTEPAFCRPCIEGDHGCCEVCPCTCGGRAEPEATTCREASFSEDTCAEHGGEWVYEDDGVTVLPECSRTDEFRATAPASSRETGRTEPAPEAGHEHVWVHKQNVTTRGYAMPPYLACACGAAKAAEPQAEGGA